MRIIGLLLIHLINIIILYNSDIAIIYLFIYLTTASRIWTLEFLRSWTILGEQQKSNIDEKRANRISYDMC